MIDSHLLEILLLPQILTWSHMNSRIFSPFSKARAARAGPLVRLRPTTLTIYQFIREIMRVSTDSKRTRKPGFNTIPCRTGNPHLPWVTGSRVSQHTGWMLAPSTGRCISDFRGLTSPLPAIAFCVDLTTAASAPGNLKQYASIPGVLS